MPEFLSPEWVDAVDRAARGSSALTACASATPFVLEQRVVCPDGNEAVHHLELTQHGARVVAGRAPHPNVVLTTDLDTACRLAQGSVNAQVALAAGRLRLGGDIDTLARRAEALLALDDVFAAVRATTTFPGADDAPITSAR
ncbi:MAG: SCP2 sterol-binding domain-containing protein [Acidimicrobiia bacterium]